MSHGTEIVIAVVLGIAFLSLFGSLLAVLLTRLFEKSGSLETLRQRYARGEIDTATFDEMRVRLKR